MTSIAYTGPSALGYFGVNAGYIPTATAPKPAPLPLAPVVPIAAPKPAAAPPIAGAPASTASSPCTRCVFNGGNQNNAVVPTSGAGGTGFIQPPTPSLAVLKAASTTPAPAGASPQAFAAFLSTWGPELAIGGLVLVLLLLAASTRRGS